MPQSMRVGVKSPAVRGNADTDLAPFVPSATRPWDRKLAGHLLRRAGFGGKDEIDAIIALGMPKTVDLLMTVSPDQLPALGAQVLPHGEVLDLTYDLNSQRAQWLYEMVNSRYPLREKLTLFWHDHFSVGAKAPEAVPLLLTHINVLRRHALGSFRDMLVDVTRDPAMLHWLDNRLNGIGGKVNENYGRELLELYTMGATGGYTQADVYDCARCLSGWTLDGMNGYRYDATLHLAGDKVVLGKTIVSAGEAEVIDLIDNVVLPWPKTAEYVVTKLWKFFVSPNPSAAVITELANRFVKSGYSIYAVMDTILRSNAFYSEEAIHSLVKSPLEYTLGAMRNTKTTIYSYKELGRRVAAMGLPLLRYTNPSGIEEGVAWLNSSTILSRNNFADELTRVSTTYGIQNRFDPFTEVVTNGLTSGEGVVDHYLKLLLDGQVMHSVRLALYDYMNYVDAGWEPFTVTPAKVTQKVRGLVHLILSLPEYQLN